jgi:hypothetical protein
MKFQLWDPHKISYQIEYNFWDKIIFICHKMTLKAIFMQKTLKMTQIVNLMMSYPHVFFDIF